MWALSVSEVGLYDDARFPGRLIVSLGDHFDHLDEVPDDLLTAFMADVATASRNLRFSLHVDRVNVAVLGNQESHVHAHLVPRLHSAEPLPHSAPWQDPRPRARLADEDRREMITLLRAAAPW